MEEINLSFKEIIRFPYKTLPLTKFPVYEMGDFIKGFFVKI